MENLLRTLALLLLGVALIPFSILLNTLNPEW
jgi:hypothetical protein